MCLVYLYLPVCICLVYLYLSVCGGRSQYFLRLSPHFSTRVMYHCRLQVVTCGQYI